MTKLRFIPELLKNAGHWLAVVCLLAVAMQVSAQCSPDVTQPVAVCKEAVVLALSATGDVVLPASSLDDGSYDECCLNSSTAFKARRLEDGPCDQDNLPDDFTTSVTFCCADLNSEIYVELQVTDCAGNSNTCLVTVTLEDKVKPACVAPANVTIACDNYDTSLAAYGAATTSDNCCVQGVTESQNTSGLNSNCNNGDILRKFTVTDCSGNTSQCSQTVTVTNDNTLFALRFPNDQYLPSVSPTGTYGEPTFQVPGCGLPAASYTDVIFPIVEDSIIKIVRTWTVINWCTYDPVLPVVTVPNPEPVAGDYNPSNFPGAVLAPAGNAAPWAPSFVKVNSTDAAPTDFSTFFSVTSNGYRYEQYIYIDSAFAGIKGLVYLDEDLNCLPGATESALASWKVKAVDQADGSTYETFTDNQGIYYLLLDNGVTYDVSLDVPFNYHPSCPTTYSFTVMGDSLGIQDIAVVLDGRCPTLSVDISAPFLRRCFPNNYQVQACNLGTELQEDAYVVVELDNYLSFNSSTVASTALGNNTYSFAVGDLAPGECRLFKVNCTLTCTAPLGTTHCSEAHIFPDTLCGNPDWSGAIVQVDGYCDGDSVRMEIKNIGTGDMIETLNFIVVEDVIMRPEASGTFQLDTGEALEFALPANGATWRLEAEQESNYPWKGFSAKAIEGCGGVNMNGLVNMFPLNTPNPFESIDCQQNVGSYDPNDKQGFPTGYGDNHYIKPNVDIDYRIRFQNTGTDTAFTVVVLDTLSEHLDIASVRPGASSHPYSFSVLDGGILQFRFDHILLPDSNVNEVASHGFLRFSVAQKADLPDNTLIENTGAIYFDFNDAVITNTTTHLVGRNFIEEVSGVKEGQVVASAWVYPNPALDYVVFKMPAGFVSGVLELTNATGQVVRSESISQLNYRLERGNLPGGMYHYSILSTDGVRFTGALTLMQSEF